MENLDREFCHLADGSKAPYFPTSIGIEEGKELQRLISLSSPCTSLEIGCAYGVSSLFICDAVSKYGGKKHIIIDPAQISSWEYQKDSWGMGGLLNLAKCKLLHVVEFHSAASEYALPDLLKRKERIQFAFIDGWHTFDQVMLEIYYINRMLDIGGLIVFDDYSDYPSIQHIEKYMLTLPQYEKISLNTGRMMAFKKISEDTRDYRFFKLF